LAFTLASVYLGYIVAIATVYMGGATIPMLFMLTGWAESFMQSKGQDRSPYGAETPLLAAAPAFSFRRVV
jgi:hypothetical protein